MFTRSLMHRGFKAFRTADFTITTNQPRTALLPHLYRAEAKLRARHSAFAQEGISQRRGPPPQSFSCLWPLPFTRCSESNPRSLLYPAIFTALGFALSGPLSASLSPDVIHERKNSGRDHADPVLFSDASHVRFKETGEGLADPPPRMLVIGLPLTIALGTLSRFGSTRLGLPWHC